MQKIGAALLCLVFAIPFGGIGVAASWALYRMIDDGYRAEKWVGVKATVDSVGRGSVAYHYSFAGAQYKGDRMGTNPLGGKDNLDSWYSDISSMLSEARASGRPINVWVNPDNPSESMVDRTIRWKLAVFALPFALGFGGVGVGAIFMFFRTLAAPAGSAVQPARRVGRSGGLLAQWVFTFFWNVISFPIAMIIFPQGWANGEWAVLFVLLFPLIGVLLLWGALSSTLARIRALFTRAPAPAEAQMAAAVAAPASRSDGFARGMIDDPRAHAGEMIDADDTGLPVKQQ